MRKHCLRLTTIQVSCDEPQFTDDVIIHTSQFTDDVIIVSTSYSCDPSTRHRIMIFFTTQLFL